MKKAKARPARPEELIQEQKARIAREDSAEELLCAAQGAALLLRSIEEDPPDSLATILGGIGSVLAAVSNRYDAYRFDGLGLDYIQSAVSLHKRSEGVQSGLSKLSEKGSVLGRLSEN